MLRVRLCLCLESADVEQIAIEAVIDSTHSVNAQLAYAFGCQYQYNRLFVRMVFEVSNETLIPHAHSSLILQNLYCRNTAKRLTRMPTQ